MFSIKKEVIIGSVILSTILATDFTLKKFTNSPNLPITTKIYNSLSYPFLNLEQKLERDFSIEYLGDKNEAVVQTLYNNLSIIQRENAALLEHTKEITILTFKESLGLDSFGFANDKGQVTLRSDYSLANLAHELSHPKTYRTSKMFLMEFLSFFPTIQTKKNKYLTRWTDGTRGPRHGYVSPYGATNVFENIATYVEKFYEDKEYSFWKQINKEEFNYELALNYLMGEGFITKAQKNKAMQLILDRHIK